jgi:serine/threonine-protein kinase
MAEEEVLFELGELVAGTYEIRGVLGEGGMARVYAAQDVILNRKVALKASWAQFEKAILFKEAQALAAIRHPGTIDVYAAGTHRDIPFFVMEHLSGVNLATFLDKRRGTPLAIAEALDILIPVADALAAVHRSGIVHRDVKPGNVMLTPSGRIVLMDFGLFQPESDSNPLQSGTPEYMAPELLLAQVDPRYAFLVDVYALGTTAFELLAGEVPFLGASPTQTVAMQLQSEPPSLRKARPDVPPRLSALIHEMLNKDPLERPPGMEAVLFRLRAARDAVVTQASPVVAVDTKFHVLIVSDDAKLARLLETHATKAVSDAAVRTVETNEKALAAARERAPHVMLVDYRSPHINAIELCTTLRGMHVAEDCAIIVVRDPKKETDLEALKQLGITRFVPTGLELGAQLFPEMRKLHKQWQASSRSVSGPVAPPKSGRIPGGAGAPPPPSQRMQVQSVREVQVPMPPEEEDEGGAPPKG